MLQLGYLLLFSQQHNTRQHELNIITASTHWSFDNLHNSGERASWSDPLPNSFYNPLSNTLIREFSIDSFTQRFVAEHWLTTPERTPHTRTWLIVYRYCTVRRTHEYGKPTEGEASARLRDLLLLLCGIVELTWYRTLMPMIERNNLSRQFLTSFVPAKSTQMGHGHYLRNLDFRDKAPDPRQLFANPVYPQTI